MKAMILAAGLGTRLRPLTDHLPKALVPVGGRPLLQILLEKLEREGCSQAVVNVHHLADMLEQWCLTQPTGVALSIASERQALLDTGGALRNARSLLGKDEHILIHNVDILSNACLAHFYAQAKNHAATLLVSQRPTSRYLLFDDQMRLVGWTNIDTGEVKSPHPSLDVRNCRRLAFSGIHQISPALLAQMDTWPQRFSIIDFYLSLCHRYPIYGAVQEGLQLLDVGKQHTLSLAEAFVRQHGL